MVAFFQGVFNGRLTRDHVEVLGNMCCVLSPPYIRDSDPLILEKLKNCADISSDQVAAVETLLLSGNTQYGYVIYLLSHRDWIST